MAQKLQSNFNAGVLSPYLEGRPDVAQFFNGLLIGRNIRLLPEGGFENIPGPEFITATKGNGFALQVGFQPTDEVSWELEFGIEYIRFRKNGVVIKTPGPELVTNGLFNADLTGWTPIDVAPGTSFWTLLDADGCLALQNSHTSRGGQSQGIATVANNDFALTFQVRGGGAGIQVAVGTTIGNVDIYPSTFHAPGFYTINFRAVGATTYISFFKDKSPGVGYVDNVSCTQIGGVPYEITSPYTETDLNEIKGRQGIIQSVDVLFICCSHVRPKELVYGGDTNWTLRDSPFDPMPSYEADFDPKTDPGGLGATLTPGATSGSGINFVASAGIFLPGDVRRVIKYGLARGLITAFVDASNVTVEILVNFPNTNPIPEGLWLLEGSPGGATLDFPNKEPIGRIMQGVFSVDAIRSYEVGKYIKTFGGLVQILSQIDPTHIEVKILSILADSDLENPDPAPAGSWTLEIPSWSDTLGWPSLNEFFQGRMALSSNNNQRTTHWLSRTNSSYNFAIGSLATDAIEYTFRSGTFGKIKWLKENGALFFGDAFTEHSLKGPGIEQPIGGDVVPFEKPESHNGSALMRPIHVGSSLLFLNWSKTKVLSSAYSFDRDAQIAKNSVFLTRDLTRDVPAGLTDGLDTNQAQYAQEPMPLIYWRRSDGVLLVHSFNDDPEGSNNGFTTLELAGEIESFCITRRGRTNVLSLIVKRTINGGMVRYIEEIRDDVYSRADCAWTTLQTQCAKVQTFPSAVAPLVVSNLGHLEGATVDVLANRPKGNGPATPIYLGTQVVSGGAITLDTIPDGPGRLVVEVGLPFIPMAKTMRPAIPQQPTEGHLRKWVKCFLRLQKSSLPVVNGTDMSVEKSQDSFDQGPFLRTGDFGVDTSDLPGGTEWAEGLDGNIVITRSKPYPLRVLALYGEIEFSPKMEIATGNEGQVHST